MSILSMVYALSSRVCFVLCDRLFSFTCLQSTLCFILSVFYFLMQHVHVLPYGVPCLCYTLSVFCQMICCVFILSCLCYAVSVFYPMIHCVYLLPYVTPYLFSATWSTAFFYLVSVNLSLFSAIGSTVFMFYFVSVNPGLFSIIGSTVFMFYLISVNRSLFSTIGSTVFMFYPVYDLHYVPLYPMYVPLSMLYRVYSEAIHRSHPQRCQRNNSQRKEERLHPRLERTAAGTSQYCQQTQREDGILPNRWKHSCLQQSKSRIYQTEAPTDTCCLAWKNVFPQHGKRYGQVVDAH